MDRRLPAQTGACQAGQNPSVRQYPTFSSVWRRSAEPIAFEGIEAAEVAGAADAFLSL